MYTLGTGFSLVYLTITKLSCRCTYYFAKDGEDVKRKKEKQYRKNSPTES
jgi:hypothetical protein